MIRQLPILPTIVVLIAAGIMVWLGIWQLGRAEEKAALIAEYRSALMTDEKLTSLPSSDHEETWFLYRRIDVFCEAPIKWRSTAARNENGQLGYAHIAKCEDKTRFRFGGEGSKNYFEAVLGWSRGPETPEWKGGEISGRLVAAGDVPKVQAMTPISGLEPLVAPDPNGLPDNHLAYAGQWFFFALTALVIYWLAMKKRLSERRED